VLFTKCVLKGQSKNAFL